MNERIKELMLQAFQENYGDPITPGAREKAVQLVEGWGEKFAKLIVDDILTTLAAHGLSNDSALTAFANITRIYKGPLATDVVAPSVNTTQDDFDF